MAPPLEISIPTTSLVPASAGEKAFTYYNITLRLPLRSFVLQKRYSEFAVLHGTLNDLVGEAPPAPLPSKSWFRSTVSSAELTEQRRSGLEAYLRAIAESPDRRWRDTSAWRAFLNLPMTSSSSVASNRSMATAASGGGRGGIENRLPAIGLAAANAAAAGDPGTWIDLHKEMKKALHDVRLHLARRDAAVDGGSIGGGSGGAVAALSSSVAVESGAAARRDLIKAGSLLSALTAGLKTLQDNKKLGEGELRRRRDLLAAARVERDGLETLSASLASARGGGDGGNIRDSAAASGSGVGADRKALFSGAGAAPGPRMGGRVLGAPLPETERTRELDNDGVAQLQRQMMAEQDQEVASLAKIVQRQRELGLAIQQEVAAQAPLLDQMHDDVDRVQAKVNVSRDRIKRLNK